MTLEEIRKRIDTIDEQVKELFLARMEIAHDVATVKHEAGESNIYRADREYSMIERLTADVDPSLKAEYAAFIRKTTEVSRMYQYGLLYDWNPQYAEELFQDVEVRDEDTRVRLQLTRPDSCNAMSAILSMIGDYGYNMDQMTLLKIDEEAKTASFELIIIGSLNCPNMKKLMFQLSREALEFRILESFS